MAENKGCTAAQLALAWVLSRGEHIFPIPGTKKMKYLDENIDALRVRLNSHELEEIDGILPKGAAAGTRYPEAMMRSVGR